MTLRSWNTSSSKTPGASQSTTSVAPEHNACNDDTPVDPFLLDFGTSVNVNEDLRHVIRGEIQEIDESINVVGSEMKKEETVEKQLRHDLAHSLSEMTNLSRCVNDQLENVHVHTTFLQGLQSTLQVDLVLSSGIKARNASVVSPQQDCDQNATSLKESAKQSNSYKDIIHCCGKKLKKMTSSMKEASRDLEELFAKHRTTIEMTQAIQQRIEVDALETVLKERTQEGNLVMQELEATKDNLQAIKLATHKKRTESGSNAQQLADLVSELKPSLHTIFHRAHLSSLLQTPDQRIGCCST